MGVREMRNILTAAAAVLALLPGAAFSQMSGGSVGLKYDKTDYDGGDVTLTTVEAKAGFDVGTNISIDVVANFSTGSDNCCGSSWDMSGNVFGVRGMYEFSPGTKVGAYVEMVSADYQDWCDNCDATLYGIEGSFGVGGSATVSAFYGITDTDVVPSSVDVTNFGVAAGMPVGNGFDVGAFYKREKASDGSNDITVSDYGIKGEYNLSQAMGAPVVIGLELAKIHYNYFDVSEFDDTRYTIWVNYLFGASGKAPDGFLGNRLSGHGLGAID